MLAEFQGNYYESLSLAMARAYLDFPPIIPGIPSAEHGGMLEWLDRLPLSTRKVLIHVNNTNPILDEDSRQRAELTQRGIEVAWDGMEIVL